MHFSQLAGNRARGDGRAFGLCDSHALGDVKQSYFHQLFLPQRKIHMICRVRTVGVLLVSEDSIDVLFQRLFFLPPNGAVCQLVHLSLDLSLRFFGQGRAGQIALKFQKLRAKCCERVGPLQ